MKIKIEYTFDNKLTNVFPYWAFTYIDGEKIQACDQSYKEAKEGLLKKVRAKLHPPKAPESEEVEI